MSIEASKLMNLEDGQVLYNDLRGRTETGLSSKVAKPTTSPNGTDGQLLQTNGDGTTTWVTQGTPTDAQVEAQVSAWLTAHPETTTTVQDGAITRAKLDSDLKTKTDLGAIAPVFAEATAYAAGTYVMKDGAMYLLPNGHTANTTWANTTKTAVTAGDQITDLKSAISEDVPAMVPFYGSLSGEKNIDTEPYLFRRCKDGIREKEKLIGGTVAWNQHEKFDRPSGTLAGVTYTNNNDGTFTLNNTATANSFVAPTMSSTADKGLSNHVYFASSNIKNPSTDTLQLVVYSLASPLKFGGTSDAFLIKLDQDRDEFQIGFRFASGSSYSNLKVTGFLCDLTQMFGSTIADAIYAMETATAGSGVAWFRSLFPKDYYEYDAGTLMSVQAGSKKVYDENENLLHTYPLDSDLVLRGIPKWADGKMYYDGDEYTPDGSVKRKYWIVDLGTMTWLYQAVTEVYPYGYFISSTAISGKATGQNILCTKYTTNVGENVDKTINSTGGNNIRIIDSSYTDPATFKTAMSGVYLVYELATPTAETADPFAPVQIIDPNGTEEYIDSRAVAVPVGHETEVYQGMRSYIDNLMLLMNLIITANRETSMKATKAYTAGNLLIVNNTLYKATTGIANGATLTVGTNVTETNIGAELALLA